MQYTKREMSTIERALGILEKAVSKGAMMTSAAATKDFLKLKLRAEESEKFLVIFLTNQHEMIAHEIMFHGTIDGAAVYPREVVKRVLHYNAAAVVFAHNHPSGIADPSQSDIAITRRLKSALELIDVRVLDHLIVGETVTSMAELGLV